MFFIFVQFIVSLFLAVVMAPKPNLQNAKPSRLSDFDFPTASDRPIPVFWGTVKQKGVNCIKYGDFKAVAIKQKVKSGLFSSKRITIGHKYYMDMTLAVAFGSERCKIKQIYFADKLRWQGESTSLIEIKAGTYYKTTPFFNLFTHSMTEEEKRQYAERHNLIKSNEDEPAGFVKFYNGSDTQQANKNLCYLEFSNFYFGKSTHIKPISVVCESYPFGPNAAYSYSNINEDANPAYIIYDLIVNKLYGAGVSPSLLDGESFEAAAKTLYDEQMGMSYLWDSPRSYLEVIKEIERHINANLRENQTTGLIELKLIRDDYDENDLPVLDENNISKLVEYNKGSIGSINTEVRVKYIDRVSQYEQRTVIAQNLGAYNEKQTISHVETEYAGFTNARNAQIAAERELIPNSVNVAQVRLECDRSAYDLNVGDPVMFKWKKLGIDAMPMRVMNVDLGTLKKGIIKISLVQDVFGFSRSTYKSNKSDWESVLTKPRDVENVLMMEAPAVLGVQPGRTTVLAAHTSAKNEEGYILHYKSYHDSTYNYASDIEGFTPLGFLTEDLSDSSTRLTISGSNLSDLEAATVSEIKQGENIAIIENSDKTKLEWVAFESVSYDSNADTYTLNNVWRGTLGTVPQGHLTGARVWFVNYGFSETADIAVNTEMRVKLTTITANGAFSVDAATSHAYYMGEEHKRPWAPGRLKVNYKSNGSSFAHDEQLTIRWTRRDHTSLVVDKYSSTTDYVNEDVSWLVTIRDRDTGAVLRSEAVLEDSLAFDNETTINPEGVHYKNLDIEVQGKIGGLKSRQKAIFSITRDNPPA